MNIFKSLFVYIISSSNFGWYNIHDNVHLYCKFKLSLVLNHAAQSPVYTMT